MKRTKLILITLLILAWTTTPSIAASKSVGETNSKAATQADKNGDGKLSKAEEAALHKMILMRFPRADADGDGVLSNKEWQAVMRQATARAKRQGGQNADAGTNKTKGLKSPTHANVKYGEHERNVFDIWLADSAKPTPLAIYIHGGGFRAGSKEKLKPNERESTP